MKILSSNDYPLSQLADQAYIQRAVVYLQPGETSFLNWDPQIDDLEQRWDWLSMNHFVPETSHLSLKIPNGVHTTHSLLKSTNNRFVSMEGGYPSTIGITSYSISPYGGNTYRIRVGLDSPLPAHIGTNGIVAIQKPLSVTGRVEGLEGCHYIDAVYSDRMTIILYCKLYGDTPISSSNLINTTVEGLYTNKLIIPQATLLFDASAWNGRSDEGCISAWEGGQINIQSIGIGITGVQDGHEELFYSARSGFINCIKYVLACGAPLRALRLGPGGKVYAGYSYFSSGLNGNEATQILQGDATFVRTTFSGGTTAAVTVGAESKVFATSCAATSSPIGITTVGSSASLTWVSSGIRNTDLAIRLSGGTLTVNPGTNIQNNLNAINFPNNSDVGVLAGNPSFINSPVSVLPNTDYDNKKWVI